MLTTVEIVVICRDIAMGVGAVEPTYPWAGVPVELIGAHPEDIDSKPEDM